MKLETYYKRQLEKMIEKADERAAALTERYEQKIAEERAGRAADLERYTDVIDSLNATIIRLRKEADALTTVIRRLCNER